MSSWLVRRLEVRSTSSVLWRVREISARLQANPNRWSVSRLAASTGEKLVIDGPRVMEASDRAVITARGPAGTWSQVSGPPVNAVLRGNVLEINRPGLLEPAEAVFRYSATGFDGLPTLSEITVKFLPAAERSVRDGSQHALEFRSAIGGALR